MIKENIEITGTIVPTNIADTFPTHISNYGKGGFKTVTNITERDNITLERREVGMIVYVISEEKFYRLTDINLNTYVKLNNTFLSLDDTPASYVADTVLTINSAGDAVIQTPLADIGKSTFLSLDDVSESSYINHEEYVVAINAAGDALEFRQFTLGSLTDVDNTYISNYLLTINSAGDGITYIDPNSISNGEPSQLELITENSNTGWRLLGRDPANYGDIGQDAIDLSFSNFTSTTLGATGDYSFAEGLSNIASGNFSHAEGNGTKAYGEYSHVEGKNTQTGDEIIPGLGIWAHAEGYITLANGNASHAEGIRTEAKNMGAHAEGYQSEANGNSSHAEGDFTIASGNSSHAEGAGTTASGNYGSHSEGWNTNATGNSSHAEGYYTTASGISSHAEGSYTYATGNYAHAEGRETQAKNSNSHTEGSGTIAENDSMHADGKFNVRIQPSTLISVTGIGIDNSNRKNGFEIHTNGLVKAPEATISIINSDIRALTTKEYVDDKLYEENNYTGTTITLDFNSYNKMDLHVTSSNLAINSLANLSSIPNLKTIDLIIHIQSSSGSFSQITWDSIFIFDFQASFERIDGYNEGIHHYRCTKRDNYILVEIVAIYDPNNAIVTGG